MDRDEQRKLCAKYGAAFAPSTPDLKVGIALHTLDRLPLNGLRHHQQGDTSGWYIYGGEEPIPQDDADFFSPLHVGHLAERCPVLERFLGLPPGYRFLVAGDYEDVWQDPSLLSLAEVEGGGGGGTGQREGLWRGKGPVGRA